MTKALAKLPLTHKQRLVLEGLRRFRTHGFNGTTVDDLLAAAEAPKGSFYHHFGTKEAFAKEVIEAYMVNVAQSLAGAVAEETGTALAKLQAYFRVLLERFSASRWRVGCLVGSLSTELAPSSDVFSHVLADALGKWRLAIKVILDEGQEDGSIRRDLSSVQLSHIVLSLIQGALTVSVASRSRETFIQVEESLPKLMAPASIDA